MRIECPRVRIYLLVAGFVFGLFASEAMAGGPPVLVDSTGGGGLTNALIVGDIAYCSMADGLLILDLSEPGSPIFLSRLRGFNRGLLPVFHFRAELRGRFLFMPFGTMGVLVFDVLDPSNPEFETQISIPTFAKEVAFSGNYMYTGGGRNDPLYTLDISDMYNPIIVDSSDADVPVFDLIVNGSFLYAAAYALYAFDISDPSHPVVASVASGLSVGSSVAVRGNFLFVADAFPARHGGLEGIVAYDLSDPSTPSLIGNPAYHALDQDAQVVGNFLYAVNEIGGLHALDISNPFAPEMVECYDAGPLPACFTFGKGTFSGAISVSVTDGYAYMASTSGLYVYTLDSRGDCNDDGIKNSSDIIWLVNYIFKSGTPPVVLEQGDVECLGGINTADIIYLVNFIFKGSDPPVCP